MKSSEKMPGTLNTFGGSILSHEDKSITPTSFSWIIEGKRHESSGMYPSADVEEISRVNDRRYAVGAEGHYQFCFRTLHRTGEMLIVLPIRPCAFPRGFYFCFAVEY